MLEKSGDGLQQSLRTANAYERKLLQEVNLTASPHVESNTSSDAVMATCTASIIFCAS